MLAAEDTLRSLCRVASSLSFWHEQVCNLFRNYSAGLTKFVSVSVCHSSTKIWHSTVDRAVQSYPAVCTLALREDKVRPCP